MTLDERCATAAGALTLMHLPGLCGHVGEGLSRAYDTIGELRDALPALASAAEWARASAAADSMRAQAKRLGVRIVATAEAGYPEWLREIPGRPRVLFVKGTLVPGLRGIACVGTRTPSRFGSEVCSRLVGHFAARRWSVVSGLAPGVDAVAHRAALKAQGHTVAVLANGLDSVYPREHASLAAEILERGGALVSEQPFGATASARNLVQRDRIQSGMSAATVVMQTDIVGGTMRTVRFAVGQDRLVFAPVPPVAHAHEPKSRGLRALHGAATDFAGAVAARGAYAAELQAFGSGPVAIPIAGREDYAATEERLEEMLLLRSERAVRAKFPLEVVRTLQRRRGIGR